MFHPIRRLIRSFLSAPATGRALVLVAVGVAVPAVALAAQHLTQHTPPMPGRIVYNRADTGVWDAYTSDPNGAAEYKVTNTKDVDMNRATGGEQQPRWSPDGQEFAFSTYDRTGEHVTIWKVPFAGGTPTALVENDKGWGSPAWQRPAGNCIVYSGERAGSTERATDLLVKCPGTAARKLVDTAEMDEDGPDWKPDGSQIVYEARQSGLENIDTKQWDLWIVNADGSDRHLLLDEPNTAERQPRWSPDGSTIAFVSYAYKAGLGKGILKTLDLTTGAVSSHVEGVAGPMAWSPDGSHILFYNTWDLGPKPVGAQAPAQGQVKGLYMLDPETHEITRLLPPAGGEQASDSPPSFEWGYAPDWTAGTYTPTPDASPTPTATTPAPSVTPSNTLTPSPSPTMPAEDTPTPKPTVDPSPDVYLPVGYKP